MKTDRDKIIKLIVILAAIIIIFSSLSRLLGGNTETLAEYAANHPEIAHRESADITEPLPREGEADGDDISGIEAGDDIPGTDANGGVPESEAGDDVSGQSEPDHVSGAVKGDGIPSDGHSTGTGEAAGISPLIGASLNSDSMEQERITYEASFYYEPLSDDLRRYITGISYPEDTEDVAVTMEELRYVHVLHYDFGGKPSEGELICNAEIAQDLVEIFYELYENEYQIEKIRLIDEYDGDDLTSMEDNNTSCFNYRVVEGTDSLSKHALGLAVDINPFYNPYITYDSKGGTRVSPASAQAYSDRSAGFPYKIDDKDLCYRLFLEHGFTWGGNWNSSKDYQHFQKIIK